MILNSLQQWGKWARKASEILQDFSHILSGIVTLVEHLSPEADKASDQDEEAPSKPDPAHPDHHLGLEKRIIRDKPNNDHHSRSQIHE